MASTGTKCSLQDGGVPRAYFPDQAGMGKADFVLKLDGARFDIGFYKNDEGHYEARTDFYGGTVEACIGAKPSKPENAEQAKMGKLFQLYAIHAATETARKKGLTVRRIPGADGRIKLELMGANL